MFSGPLCVCAYWLLDKVCAGRTTFAVATAGSHSLDPRAACALSLTRAQLADTTHLSVLGHASWLRDFVEAADVPVTLLPPGEVQIRVHNRQYDVFFLVFDEAVNRTNAEDALALVRKTDRRHSPRVVVWWRTGDVQAVVQAARDLDLVRLAVVSTFGTHQQILAYREDCEGGLGVARAVPVGECTQKGLLHVDEDPFLDQLRWNLRGCTLQVGTEVLPPAVLLIPRPGGSYEFSGIIPSLMRILAERVNATLNISLSSDKKGFGWVFPNGTALGVLGDVMHKRRDIGINDIIWAKERNAVVELSPGYKPVCLTLTMPAGIGPESSSWYLVFRMFSPSVWTCVVISYFMVLAAWCFPWSGPGAPLADKVALFMVCILLGSPYGAVSLPTSRVKILAAAWMLLTIVLGTAYNALRQSLMAAPSPRAEIETLDQIEKRGLKLVGYASALAMLSIVAEEEGNSTLMNIAANHEETLDFNRTIKRLVTDRNIALLSDPDSSLYYAAPMEEARRRRLVHVLRGYCAIRTHVAAFMVRQGSPLTSPANYLISRAFECGLTHYWKSRFHRRRLEILRRWKKLKLSKLGAVFKLLLIGLATGAVVFTVEVLWNKTRPNVL